jgi:hypothetical protein
MGFWELDETSEAIKQPKDIKIKLRPHQLTSIKAMSDLEDYGLIKIDDDLSMQKLNTSLKPILDDKSKIHLRNTTCVLQTNSAILADKVGAGKTLSAIGLIAQKRVPLSHDKFIFGSNHFSIKAKATDTVIPVNLIIVPHSLVIQWRSTLKLTTLKHYQLSKTKDFDLFYDITVTTPGEEQLNKVELTENIELDENILLDKKFGTMYRAKTMPVPPMELINMTDITPFNPFRNIEPKFSQCKKSYQERMDMISKGMMLQFNKGFATPIIEHAIPLVGRALINNTPKPIINRVLNPDKVKKFLEETEVLLLNINRYDEFVQIFKNVNWARVMIDEMDTISLPKNFNEFGNFNWFITATPKRVYTNRHYVGKIFGQQGVKTERGTTQLDLADFFSVKNLDLFVDQSTALPNPHVFIINTMADRVLQFAQGFITDDIKEMLSAGNVKGAILKLNCNQDTKENLVEIITKKIKTQLYNTEIDLEQEAKKIPLNKEQQEVKLKKLREEISSLKTKLKSIEERIESLKDECCVICADDFKNPTIVDCCKNVFCLNCLIESSGKFSKCPYCRSTITPKDFHVIMDEKKEIIESVQSKEKLLREMSKTQVLESLLKHIYATEPDARLLLFSNYSETFKQVTEITSKLKLKYAILAGTGTRVNNIINDYRDGKINILMMDAEHYGSGLNLQMTTHLVLYHRLDPHLETQVIGRGHRFGRKTPIKIIYMRNSHEADNTPLTSNPIRLDKISDFNIITNPPEIKQDLIVYDEEDDIINDIKDDNNNNENDSDSEVDTEDEENEEVVKVIKDKDSKIKIRVEKKEKKIVKTKYNPVKKATESSDEEQEVVTVKKRADKEEKVVLKESKLIKGKKVFSI